MMKLILEQVPLSVMSAYPVNKEPKVHISSKMAWGHPDLVASITALEAAGYHFRYSDIFRSAESSLDRRRQFEAQIHAYDVAVARDPSYAQTHKRPTQLAKRPGESPHNFGLSVDIDYAHAMKMYGLNKRGLDELMAKFNLFCHLVDNSLANEAWHYNALGPNAAKWLAYASAKSTSRAVEARVMDLYAAQMQLTPEEITNALKQVGATSVRSFQASWDLEADGIAGKDTQRLLAYLTATR